MATSSAITERRQQIVAAIAEWAHGGPTTTQLKAHLGTFLNLSDRQIERELTALHGQGSIEKRVDKWLVTDTEEYERFSSEFAACMVTKMAAKALDFALPVDVQRQLNRFIAKSERLMTTAFVNRPARRWLDALKIIPASSYWNIPYIKPDVRDAIERQELVEVRIPAAKRSPIVHGFNEGADDQRHWMPEDS